jgi:cobalt-zinc-cadmium efflux system protein
MRTTCTYGRWCPGKDMITPHLASRDDSVRVLDDAGTVLAARGLDHITIQIEAPERLDDCSTCW